MKQIQSYAIICSILHLAKSGVLHESGVTLLKSFVKQSELILNNKLIIVHHDEVRRCENERKKMYCQLMKSELP